MKPLWVGGILVAGLAMMSAQRVPVFSTWANLWTDAAHVSDHPRVLLNYGSVLAIRGDHAGACAVYRRAAGVVSQAYHLPVNEQTIYYTIAIDNQRVVCP